MTRGRIISRAARGGSRARRGLRALRRREDGQALVELALVLPLLLLVVLGIVDFGRAINYWNDQNHLANLGARYAAVGTLPTSGSCSTSTTIVTYLQCEAGLDSPELQSGSGGSTGVQTPGVGVCVSVPSNATGNQVTVKVSSTYNWLPLPAMLGGRSTSFAATSLSGTATMRLEAPAPSSWITTTSACP